MVEQYPPCEYCGETRLHFAAGPYCVRVLKDKLAQTESDLTNERDERRREPGYATLVAMYNASQAALSEAVRDCQSLHDRAVSAEAERDAVKAEFEACQLVANSQAQVIRDVKEELSETQVELGKLLNESEYVRELRQTLDFHKRAARLMQKRKNFVVVAEDEPYYIDVYRTIRNHEGLKGRWTLQDEIAFKTASKRWVDLMNEQE